MALPEPVLTKIYDATWVQWVKANLQAVAEHRCYCKAWDEAP